MTDTTSPPPTTAVVPPLPQRLRRLWPYFRHARAGIGLAFVGTLLAALTEPAIPALLKALLDQGFSTGSFPMWTVPAALMGLFALRGVATFLANYGLSHTATQGMVTLRQAMFARLNTAQLDLFAQQSASKLSNTVVYEVQSGTTLLVGALLTSVRTVLTIVALLVYLLYLNWQLTGIVLALFPPLAWVMRSLSKRLYHITRSSQHATDELAYVVEENVLAHRMVRLHGAQAQQAERFERLNVALRRLAMKSTIAGAAMTPLSQLLAAAALSAVIMVALWQSNAGATVGGFVGFVTAMLMLITPIRQLADIAGTVTRGLAALERGLELVEDTREQTGGRHRVDRALGQIALERVWVRYGNKDGAALRDLSLQVRPGEVVALVGPSGSGKTTLANLLPRFVEVSEGQVSLDGVRLTDWDLGNLRAQFAMVSQDVVMLNDTLAHNVALGATVDEARVQAALASANLAELVQHLPRGMHTVVGHNATELSGGQRQRLAIARAIYKDAPVLILDEATSALDNESERLVQEALSRLMRGRTTLVIAHRLSTIEHADRVVVLADGQIVEQGSHAELLAANGAYARLQAQAQHAVDRADTAPQAGA
ncbi:lipid A export permease/ATP-binding protein MsbA [Macromonas nakdongensis]|uniref:lipid A export permease/ATP-binding protein MsbA n=1 Tax=Macromonas nakdongensis TaxID=1843082 RepID=UPI000C33B013